MMKLFSCNIGTKIKSTILSSVQIFHTIFNSKPHADIITYMPT